MLRVILVLALGMLPQQLDAATKIQQKIETTFNGKVYKSNHTWTIDSKSRFTLNVQSQSGESQYIFNGRTFFICATLKQEQLDFLKKNKIDGNVNLGKFASGACQTVPSNFMVRFFLSPSDAIESIDFSDGLKVSLDLEQFKIAPSNKNSSKILGKNCKGITKGYSLTKTDSENKKSDKGSSSSEMCVIQELDWSKKFWREVAKVVLRQMGGSGKLIATLRKNLDSLQSFALSSQSTQKLQTADKKSLLITRKLTTTSIEEVKINNNFFALPAGFGVFNPENISLKNSNPSKNKSQEKSEREPINTITSVFFCAISGGFGCFNF